MRLKCKKCSRYWTYNTNNIPVSKKHKATITVKCPNCGEPRKITVEENKSPMKQLYIVIHRRIDGYYKVHVGQDLDKAIVLQRALIESATPTLKELEQVEKIVEADNSAAEVIKNLSKRGIDRLYNNKDEVTILFMPGRDKLNHK